MNAADAITDYDEVMRTVAIYREQALRTQIESEGRHRRRTEAQRLYDRRYYMAHRDERLAYQNRYNHENYDKVKAYQEQYRKSRTERKQHQQDHDPLYQEVFFL